MPTVGWQQTLKKRKRLWFKEAKAKVGNFGAVEAEADVEAEASNFETGSRSGSYWFLKPGSRSGLFSKAGSGSSKKFTSPRNSGSRPLIPHPTRSSLIPLYFEHTLPPSHSLTLPHGWWRKCLYKSVGYKNVSYKNVSLTVFSSSYP